MWDRSDLLRRLQSYKASTWFCKPPGAGPLDCARRGWINTSLDMLTCEVIPIHGVMHLLCTYSGHVGLSSVDPPNLHKAIRTHALRVLSTQSRHLCTSMDHAS